MEEEGYPIMLTQEDDAKTKEPGGIFDLYLVKIWVLLPLWLVFLPFLFSFGAAHVQLWSSVLHYLKS